VDQSKGYRVIPEGIRAGEFEAAVFINAGGNNSSRAKGLASQLNKFIGQYPYILVHNPADFMLDIGTGKTQDTISLVDNSGNTRNSIFLKPKEELTEPQWKSLFKSLQSAMRINYLRNMPDGGLLVKGISVEIIPSAGGMDSTIGEFNLKNGDEFHFKITNTGNRNLFYNIIDITPDGNIDILLPNSAMPPADCQVLKKYTYETDLLSVTEGMPRGKELFKFIFSETAFDLRTIISRMKTQRAGMQSIEKIFDDMYNEEDQQQHKKRDMSNVEIDKTGIISVGYTIK
jgi:hypothetical protein